MSQALLSRYVEERQSIEAHVENVLGKAHAQERDLVDEEIRALEESKQRMAEIDRQVDSLKSVMEAREASMDVSHLLARGEARQRLEQAKAVEKRRPIMSDVVDAPEFRNYRGGKAMVGEINLTPTELRAPLQEGAAPGSLLLPEKQKFMAPFGEVQFHLLENITRLPVSSNAVDMVVFGSPHGATGAAKVAELAAKPEATITGTTTTVSVDTVAYWIQVSRQLLQDAPAARSIIDNQLRLGLLTKMETDIAAAIGAATIPGVTGASGQTPMEVARTAIATVQAAGFRPNVILTDPATAAGFDLFLLAKTQMGAVFGNGIWGMEVVAVPGLTATYVGDFKTGVTLLERRPIELFISDSHEDTFVKNIFTILAEARYKAVVTQPAALAKLTITP